MTVRKEITDICYRFILTSVIAMLIFLEIYNYYDPELITGRNIISVLLISLSFNVILLIYNRIHFYLIPAIVLVAGVFALLIDKEDALLILDSVMFKLVIIGFAAFVLFLIADAIPIIHLAASAGLLVFLFVVLFRDSGIHPASPGLIVFYIVFSVSRAFRSGKARQGQPEEEDGEDKEAGGEKNSARLRRYVTFLMPFLLAFPVIIIALPKPDEPISWDWAKRLYNIAADKINEIAHEISMKFSSFDENQSGITFGYDDEMNYDNSSDNEATLLHVYAESRIYGSCYLKGEIFNVFRDGGWQNTLKTEKDFSAIDTFETYYGVVNFDSDVRNDILRMGTLKVRYLDFISKIMFAPAKMLPTYKLSGGDTVETDNEHVLFSDWKTYGTEYSVDYYQLNYASRPFKDYMEARLTENMDAFYRTKNDYLNFAFKNIRFEDILEYRQFIKDNYTSSPIIRDSVKEWINAVTADADSDYAKLKAVEDALAGYEYTFADGRLPDYVQTEGDFLDYFLLQKRSGYCVHFATAFCLIAREMGFPSRVIQGYKLRVEANQDTIVYNKYGHTWPEVYFEGKGWISFEPTPGMAVERYGRWMIFSGKYSEYQEDYNSFNHPQEVAAPVDEEYEESHTESRVSGMLILIIAGIIIFSMIFLVIFTVAINRIKRGRLNADRLYALEFRDILNILKELKIYRAEDETVAEFAARCKGEIKTGQDTKLSFGFFDTYENFAYGNREIGDQEMNEITSAKGKLLILLKEACGLTYPLHKLRLYFATSLSKT